MAITLDSMVKAGLLLAFIIPLFTYITITLPTPTPLTGASNTAAQYNISRQYNATATYISTQFAGTTTAIQNLSLGSSGGFYASAIEYEAFAFIFDGFGQMMQDIVQLPILDAMTMHLFLLGLQQIMPGILAGVLVVGIGIMQTYLLFSLIMTGLGMIMKYNPKSS
jgi:hypothetical protein